MNRDRKMPCFLKIRHDPLGALVFIAALFNIVRDAGLALLGFGPLQCNCHVSLATLLDLNQL